MTVVTSASIAQSVQARAMDIAMTMLRYPRLRQGDPSRDEAIALVEAQIERLGEDFAVLARKHREEVDRCWSAS
jgi:hypothetical protein